MISLNQRTFMDVLSLDERVFMEVLKGTRVNPVTVQGNISSATAITWPSFSSLYTSSVKHVEWRFRIGKSHITYVNDVAPPFSSDMHFAGYVMQALREQDGPDLSDLADPFVICQTALLCVELAK